jgi:hypothetical protein
MHDLNLKGQQTDLDRYLTYMKVRQIIGIVIALPVTMLTVCFYILPFWLMGWYRYAGWYGKNKKANDKSPLGIAPVWILNLKKCPAWLLGMWSGWAGHCVGTAVVLSGDLTTKRDQITLNHELHHVDQMHRLGVLQPMLYLISSVTAWLAGEKFYESNLFEVAARRAAGQIVDPQSFIQGYSAGKNQTQSKRSSEY